MSDFENNYILLSGADDVLPQMAQRKHLGHELFFTRKILLLLLYNNLINKNVTIVTLYNDRKFLYENYFNNVITYKEYKLLNTNHQFLNLCPYLLHTQELEKEFLDSINAPQGKTIPQLIKLGLKKKNLIDNQIFQNTNTADFNKFICNLNYVSLNNFKHITDKQFVVIHIRPTSKYINYLLEFIQYCKSCINNLEFVIFTTLKNIEYPNQTNNLQIYASFMNHKNCKALISEWSGGGQLSQFCAIKVIYYFDNYPQLYYSDSISEYENNNNKNFYDNWDHYNPIGCKKRFITNDELINKSILKSYILD